MRVRTLVILIVLAAVGYKVAQRMGYFKKAEQAVTEGFAAHYAKGSGLYQTEKYEEAVKELLQAVEAEPKHKDAPDALRRAGECYRRLDKKEKSIECYERVLKEYPDYPQKVAVEAALAKVKTMP
jgi:TolA-binding protein